MLPRLKRIIQVHGCFWHLHGCRRCRIPATRRAYWVEKLLRNRARDQRNKRKLNRLGWRILTVWECELADVDKLSRRLKKFLEA